VGRSFSFGISICPVVCKVFVDLFTIEPRPVTSLAIEPRPVKHAPKPAQQIAARAIVAHTVAPTVKDDPDASPDDGPSQADILLEAIVLVARKPQTVVTRAAMRNLIAKFSCECGLDF
jgi:hypothetical protein